MSSAENYDLAHNNKMFNNYPHFVSIIHNKNQQHYPQKNNTFQSMPLMFVKNKTAIIM